jgi:hypothetical protein
MAGSEERPEETGQSYDARRYREQLTEQLAERYRHRPITRMLILAMGRSDVVLVGMYVASIPFLLLFTFIFITGLKTGLEQWASWRPLLRDGITTQAIVTDGTDPGTDDHRIRYTYEATTANGKSKSYEHWENVNRFKSFEVGDEVSIIYDPAEPSHSEIEGSQTYLFELITYLPGVCILVPLTILWMVLPLIALRNRIAQWVRG